MDSFFMAVTFVQFYSVNLNAIKIHKWWHNFVGFSFWQRMGYTISGTGLMIELGKLMVFILK